VKLIAGLDESRARAEALSDSADPEFKGRAMARAAKLRDEVDDAWLILTDAFRITYTDFDVSVLEKAPVTLANANAQIAGLVSSLELIAQQVHENNVSILCLHISCWNDLYSQTIRVFTHWLLFNKCVD
jgi:hypothetical protein